MTRTAVSESHWEQRTLGGRRVVATSVLLSLRHSYPTNVYSGLPASGLRLDGDEMVLRRTFEPLRKQRAKGQLGGRSDACSARRTPDLEGAHPDNQQYLADAESEYPPLSALDRADLEEVSGGLAPEPSAEAN